MAAGECGPAVAGVVTCNDTSNNPFADGITYASPGIVAINLGSGIILDRTAGTANVGVQLQTFTGAPAAITLSNGVVVNTSGLYASGVVVQSSGDMFITSAADIAVAVPTSIVAPTGVGTYGLQAWASDSSGAANIGIVQQANSSINVSGMEGIGIYSLNNGAGSATISASGSIGTAGFRGYGINAWNTLTTGGTTPISLTEQGTVVTDGEEAVGLYSLNDGSGDASISLAGQIETLNYSSDAAIAYITNASSAGNARISASESASVTTKGDISNGLWALNFGLGEVSVASGGTITTDGASSNGIRANIYNSASAGQAAVSMLAGARIDSKGTEANGILVNNRGVGASSVSLQARTFVMTSGARAYGISITGTGTASLRQEEASVISASGEQSFAANLTAAGYVDVNIAGVQRPVVFSVLASRPSRLPPIPMCLSDRAGRFQAGGRSTS
ncbi:hypothetical protein VW35_00230 [Devosia soli]|uniref:Uncharacterized protein n=2 Tax=Devosia soli TaxID=361041 RepID=A0A0F5LJP7_9HYPH|nr:hypothetical protein VW35_00230 [Devosia soli]